MLCSARTVYANAPSIGVAARHGIAATIASGRIGHASAEQATARERYEATH